MPDSPATSRPRIVCLGAGGHATVVLEAIIAAGACDVVGLLDANAARQGQSVIGHPVLGGDDRLGDLVRDGATGFVVAFDGVGTSTARTDAFQRAKAAGLDPVTVVHPAAVVSPSAMIGAGTVILAGVVVNARAQVGENAILNTRSIVEHDARIGAHAHVAPGAIVLGSASVGDGAHIGAGAVVREGVAVGPGAVVGAGAVVVRPVEAGATVVGVPAVPRGAT